MSARDWHSRVSQGCAVALLALGCSAGGAAAVDASIASPTGETVEDVAIVLEPRGAKAPLRKARVVIEQNNREFAPYVTRVQRETAIEFPNRDPFKHHIYSFSPAKVFEVKLYQGKPAQPVTFDKVGVVVLGCNIHDWMEAHILVVDTPYFGKTGSDGLVHIDQVPAGRYTLRVWHPRQTAALPEQEVEIGQRVVRLRLVLSVAPRPVKPHPPMPAEGY